MAPVDCAETRGAAPKSKVRVEREAVVIVVGCAEAVVAAEAVAETEAEAEAVAEDDAALDVVAVLLLLAVLELVLLVTTAEFKHLTSNESIDIR